MVDTAQQRPIFQVRDKQQCGGKSEGIHNDIANFGGTRGQVILNDLDAGGIEKQNHKTAFTCKPGKCPLEKQKKGEKSDEMVDDIACGNDGRKSGIVRQKC